MQSYNRKALLLVTDMERNDNDSLSMRHDFNISCCSSPLLGKKPCTAITTRTGDSRTVQLVQHQFKDVVVTGCMEVASSHVFLLYGECLCTGTSVIEITMQGTLLEHLSALLQPFHTILHNQIIVCDVMAANIIMQRCLKIGTIATLPLHKVLLHAETLTNLCCKNSNLYGGSIGKQNEQLVA